MKKLLCNCLQFWVWFDWINMMFHFIYIVCIAHAVWKSIWHWLKIVLFSLLYFDSCVKFFSTLTATLKTTPLFSNGLVPKSNSLLYFSWFVNSHRCPKKESWVKLEPAAISVYKTKFSLKLIHVSFSSLFKPFFFVNLNGSCEGFDGT